MGLAHSISHDPHIEGWHLPVIIPIAMSMARMKTTRTIRLANGITKPASWMKSIMKKITSAKIIAQLA